MKLRFLHYLLQDKKGYHKDDNLKQRWDSYLYVLNGLRKQSYNILRDKFIYFLKYKKWTTFKRLIFGFGIFILLYSGIYYGGKTIVISLGWDKYFTKEIVILPQQTVYVPDTIQMDKYIKNFSIQTDLTLKQANEKFEFVIVYTTDSTKTLKKFLERLGEIESRNNYQARRPGSQYLGRWQIGDAARRSVGFGNISYDKFLNTPEIQDAAVVLLLKLNYSTMEKHLKKYNNKIIRGYHLTTSGLLAMAHNVGADAVIKFLNSNCSIVPQDGNGPADRFLILGNYELSSLEK